MKQVKLSVKLIVMSLLLLCLSPLSLNADDSDLPVGLYKSPKNVFTLNFPAEFTTDKVKTKSGEVFTLGSIHDQNIYMVKYGVNTDSLDKSQWNKYLSKVYDSYVGGNKPLLNKNIDMTKIQGKQIKIIEQQGSEKIFKYVRFLVTESSWYTLQVYSYSEFPTDDQAKVFFNSFKLL